MYVSYPMYVFEKPVVPITVTTVIGQIDVVNKESRMDNQRVAELS